MKLTKTSYSKKTLLGIIIIFVLFVGINFFGLILKRTSTDNESKSSVTLSNSDRYELSSKNAKYTIVEYFDFDCYHCRDLHAFKKNNKDKLDNINLVVRNFPLLNAGKSAYKAVLGECIAEQGLPAWFSFIDVVYLNFDRKYEDVFYENIGRKLVLDIERYNKCIKSVDIQNKVQNDRAIAIINQIYEVPSLIVFKNQKFEKSYIGLSGKTAFEILKYYNNLNRSSSRGKN